jgi:hypothetical protein
VQELTTRVNDTAQPSRSGGYAEWVALGAIVVGAVGAIVGASRCVPRDARHPRMGDGRPDSALLTAPHGDKLFP